MSVCESILSLSPYQGGKPISELQRELGLEHVVKLASNENPLGVGPKALEAMQSAASEAGRYPDGNGFELKQAISKHLSVSSEGITLGNGSNDILELIARAYLCQAKDEVIFSQYAFVVYPLVTQALGVTAVVTPANDFGHDLDLPTILNLFLLPILTIQQAHCSPIVLFMIFYRRCQAQSLWY